jgi:hypothetical protein
MMSLLRPMPFFAGLIVGLFGLAWLGGTIESEHLKSGFVRFHQKISPESGYYPTARQLISLAKPPATSAAKVTVVIGGSSILAGVGQESSLVWTRELEALLGPQYRVVNLSIRATNSMSNGNIAAEWLLSQSSPVIFVANPISAPAASARYLIFDAWQRGYLLPWPARDRVFEAALCHGSADVRSAALAAILNRYLNFNDLWNTVAFDHLSLVWNFLLGPLWYWPRYKIADPELTEDVRASHLYTGDFQHEMAVARRRAAAAARWPIGKEQISSNIELYMPHRLRAVTLAVMTQPSPYYIKRLDPIDQERIHRRLEDITALHVQLGINRALIATNGFTEEDYVDSQHLSVAGGRKLARAIAPEIVAMAQKLGYIP